MDTNIHYSPHDQLPAPEPRTESPPMGYFYENTAKHLIKDTVRIMMNGLHIDLDKVEELEKTLDQQLLEVQQRLQSNPLIQEFQQLQHSRLVQEYIEDRKSKMRKFTYYLKEFKHSDMVHRSYFMNLFADQQGIPKPSDLLPGTNVPKWTVNAIKPFAKTRPILHRFLEGSLKHPLMSEAMHQLAKDKADMYNQKYLDAIQSPEVPIPDFNPSSSKQKQELFEWLDITAEKTSKTTGLPSFDRAEIERINKETTDENIRDFTQSFIDHSFAAIVRNNFINAFYRYTVDDRLYGQYKLLGAKSGRYTSSNPNMLNQPSTGSIFAKPIKQCFTAPDGFLIATADYSALEDRVIASLSRDTNKCNIFLQNLDGHCLNAYGYFKDQVAQHMPISGDTTQDVKQFFQLVEEGNKDLKAIRQAGKPATFGLSYGAYPPKVSNTLKIPLSEAEKIFNSYHNELYPGITEYREEYILPTVRQHGRIHLGLGFYLDSDDAKRDIRTLNNATCQFWSILTALTINKMHQLIDDAGYQDHIRVTSTIYDSIYFEVRAEAKYVKWLNDHLIPLMITDFMEDQTIKNTADLEIGSDWADLRILRNNASIEETQHLIDFYRIVKQVELVFGITLNKDQRQHIEDNIQWYYTADLDDIERTINEFN